MSNGFLSQEEVDSLLNGGANKTDDSAKKTENSSNDLSDIEKDLLGEVGNISMGSASTALSSILSQKVNITTPVVTVETFKELEDSFETPNVALEVGFTSGIVGKNVLVMKTEDAGVIANLMMGKPGNEKVEKLSEIELSAVSEAMNQMIGSAATSMATMFSREVGISTPSTKIWKDKSDSLADDINEDDTIVKISFTLLISDLVNSQIMQILPLATAKKIVSIMMGQDKIEEKKQEATAAPTQTPTNSQSAASSQNEEAQSVYDIAPKRVEARKADFRPLESTDVRSAGKNIDLILDVPLEISVVLGRSKKTIKDILNFGTGSLVTLDRLAEEPVEILVNGKRVAYGEVMVVDENFAVRITSIISGAERVKSLGK